jgi:hypothetical protein
MLQILKPSHVTIYVMNKANFNESTLLEVSAPNASSHVIG